MKTKVLILEVPERLTPAEIAELQNWVKARLKQAGHDYDIITLDGGKRLRTLTGKRPDEVEVMEASAEQFPEALPV